MSWLWNSGSASFLAFVALWSIRLLTTGTSCGFTEALLLTVAADYTFTDLEPDCSTLAAAATAGFLPSGLTTTSLVTVGATASTATATT